MIDIKKELIKAARNSIRLTISGNAEQTVGGTRFGGAPDVPENFEWAYYVGVGLYDEVKNRPLAFLAQFDLEALAPFDKDGLLPKTGVLSFFYELNSQKWGFDPDDEGCARVYWFEDKTALHKADYPDDLSAEYRLPALKIAAKSEKSYQSFQDFLLQREKLIEEWERFEKALGSLGVDVEEYDEENITKLLGWADPIQNNMTMKCELISRGYYLGAPEDWDEIPALDKQEAKQWSAKDWLPLFQLDTVKNGDFELMFGDGGRIYFYIRRDDLANRDFSKVWLVLQCG